LFSPTPVAAEQWTWFYPYTPQVRPPGTLLGAVDFADPMTAVAVGSNGRIVRTTDGGSSWASIESGTSAKLMDVAFADASTGVIVGELGLILRTTDAGVTWTPVSSPTTNALRSISFGSATSGMAVGNFGTALWTGNGGATWIPRSTGTSAHLGCVDFVSANRGWFCGGCVFKQTSDGGLTWQNVPTLYCPWKVDFADSLVGYALTIDGYYLYRTVDGGATYESWQLYGQVIDGFYNGLTTLDQWNSVQIVTDCVPGDDYGCESVFCDAYVVRRTLDGGISTDTQVAREAPLEVAFGDNLHGIAVHDDANIYVTSDGGYTWSTVTAPPPGAASAAAAPTIYDVSFGDDMTAIAVGDNGLVYRTATWGVHWTAHETWADRTYVAVSTTDSRNATAVGPGGTIARTTDGGLTWDMQDAGTLADLKDVSFVDSLTGVIVGDSTILRTDDAGANWVEDPADSGVVWRGVDMIDAQTVVAVGNEGWIARTSDGGVNWVYPTKVTTSDLRRVTFVDDSFGVAVGGSSILRSENDGVSWTYVNTHMGMPLYDVAFSDGQNGMAATQWGVLRTRDGGLNWCYERTGMMGYLYGVHYHGEAVAVGAGGIIGTLELLVATLVQSFFAVAHHGHVTMDWQIESDDEIAGFKLLRESDGVTDVLPPDGLLDPSARHFTDDGASPGRDYTYTLVVVLADGSEIRSGPQAVSVPAVATALEQNWPNPFNPTTEIAYSLSERGRVTLAVYDVLGRRVRTLVDRREDAGAHKARWNGLDDAGRSVPSGVYFYRMRAGRFVRTRKMVLIR